MKLKNTSGIADDLIREMVKFCRPSGIANFEITVKHTHHGGSGRAYPSQSRVLINAPHSKSRLRPVAERGGYLPMPVMTGEEKLLWLLAHELRHLWQQRVPSGRRVWGARGKFSERDADAYALRALRHWRRGQEMP
jgi:hypothetical protein